MAPSPQETPIKGSKSFSITKKLRDIATPTRSPTLRKLVLSSIPPRSTGSTNGNKQIKSVGGKNTDNLAGWMSSIRKRARLALLQDDDFEQQTDSQIEKAKHFEEQELLNENASIAHASDSFNKLGEILSKKRVIGSVQPHLVNQDEKRQKITELHDGPFIEEEEKQPLVHKSDMSEEEQFPEEESVENYYHPIDTEPKSILSGFQQKIQEEQQHDSSENDGSDEDEEEQIQPLAQSDSDSDIEILSDPEDAALASVIEPFADDLEESEDEENIDIGSEAVSPAKYSYSSEEESEENESQSYSDEEEEKEELPVRSFLDVEAREAASDGLDGEPTESEDSGIEEIIEDDDEEVEQEISESDSESLDESEASSSHEIDHHNEPVPDSANLFASEEYSSHIIDPSFTSINHFETIPLPTSSQALHQFDDVTEELVSETQLANALQNLADSAEIHHQFHHEQVNHGDDHFVPRSEVHDSISNDTIETLDSIPATSFPIIASAESKTKVDTFDHKEPEPVFGIGINGLPIKNLNFHDSIISVQSDTTVNFSFGQSFIHKPSNSEPSHETNEVEKEILTDLGGDNKTTPSAVEIDEQVEKAPLIIPSKPEDLIEDAASSTVDHKDPASLSAPIAFSIPTLSSSVGYSFGERFYTPVEVKPVVNTKYTNIIKASSKFGLFAANVWADLSQSAQISENYNFSDNVDAPTNLNKSTSEPIITEKAKTPEIVQKFENVESEIKSQKNQQEGESGFNVSSEAVAVLDPQEAESEEVAKPQQPIDNCIVEDTEMPDIDEVHFSDDSLSLRAQDAFTALGGLESEEPEKNQDYGDFVEVNQSFGSEKNDSCVQSENISDQARSSVKSDSEGEGQEASGFVSALEETQYHDTVTAQDKQNVFLVKTNSEAYHKVPENVMSEQEDAHFKSQNHTEDSMQIDPLLLQPVDQPTVQSEDEELEKSDDSVIFLDEINVPQENEDDESESESDQSENNYTLNETARLEDPRDDTGNSVLDRSASDLPIPPKKPDTQFVSDISQSLITKDSTGNARVRAESESEKSSGNPSEDSQNELDDRSDSDGAGVQSPFFIDQLNEVESTQIEESDDSESLKEKNDEVNAGSPTASDAVYQSELDEVVLSKIEQEVLNEEERNLAEEDPEFNAEELIDQGTPVSMGEDDSDAPKAVVETLHEETTEDPKNSFLQDDSDSALEKTKENISIYLMDNPTSDDYLYEARMQEAAAAAAAAAAAHEQQIQSTESAEHAEIFHNTSITVEVVKNFHHTEAVVSTDATENQIQVGESSGADQGQIQDQVSAVENITVDLEPTPAAAENADYSVVAENSHASLFMENAELANDDSNSAVGSVSEAENDSEKAKSPVSEPESVQDENEIPGALEVDAKLAKENVDQSEQTIIDKAQLEEKPEQDGLKEKNIKLETQSLDDDEQDGFEAEDEDERKYFDDKQSTLNTQLKDTMDIDPKREIAENIHVQESSNKNQKQSEAAESKLQEDVEMEDIAKSNDEPQPIDSSDLKEAITTFLDKLAKSSDNDDDEDNNKNIKLDEDEENEQKTDLKLEAHSNADINESGDDDDVNSKDEKPVGTKLRRTKRTRVLTKKSAFLAEVLKQQKRKTRNAATAAAKEEKVTPQVALTSPPPPAAISKTTTKRTPKERKSKLETAKKQKTLRRIRADTEASASGTEGATNSPPHMSLRSGRRIATGTDSAAAATSVSEPGTTTEAASTATGGKGRGGRKSVSESGTGSKGPVAKKAAQSGTSKRKGRGKSRKH